MKRATDIILMVLVCFQVIFACDYCLAKWTRYMLESKVQNVIRARTGNLWTLHLWRTQRDSKAPPYYLLTCAVYTGEDQAIILKWRGIGPFLRSLDSRTFDLSDIPLISE